MIGDEFSDLLSVNYFVDYRRRWTCALMVMVIIFLFAIFALKIDANLTLHVCHVCSGLVVKYFEQK